MQQPEHTSGDHWENSKDFTRSTDQTPDHPEDLSLSHTKDRTWASDRANMEETMEEHTIEGDTDEDGTLVTRLEDEEEGDWKDTHMESEERNQITDTSRYVVLRI